MPDSSWREVVFFDFDGVLTHKDTLFAFLRFSLGPFGYYRALTRALPLLVLAGAAPVFRAKAKEMLLAIAFKGMAAEQLFDFGTRFTEKVLPHLLRAPALAALAAHQNSGQACVLITASLDWWTLPFANANGLTLISTRGQMRNGRFSGKFDGLNCNGPEKARRAEELFPRDKFIWAVAYGDSAGDKELLALSKEAHYRPFRSG